MKYDHDSGRQLRVREPVQVYLGPEEQDRLGRLTEELDATKSDVLRRGLEALERELLDPAHHPALGIIGIAATDPDVGVGEVDAARAHDAVLTDGEVASWWQADTSDQDTPR